MISEDAGGPSAMQVDPPHDTEAGIAADDPRFAAGRGSDATPAGPSTSASPERALNVADALDYLDSVKIQFSSQPDVYNRFLDIMKEFKSQLLNTPGVIKRVSHLFQGHPSLIQGFNTFLPSGYRIEAQDSDVIRVITPNGVLPMDPVTPVSTHTETVWSAAPRDVPPAPVQSEEMDSAVDFLQQVRKACSPGIYSQIMSLLRKQAAGQVTQEETLEQTQVLLRSQPGLQATFRTFVERGQGALLNDSARTAASDAKSKRKQEPALSASSSSSQQKVKKRKVEKEPVKPKKPKVVESHVRYTQPASPSRRSAQTAAIVQSAPTSTVKAPSAPVTNDEMHFFARAKRFLDNRDTYNSFLKCINLFTQGFINRDDLIRQSTSFFGEQSDLLRQLKDILEWDGPRDGPECRVSDQREQAWGRPIVANFQPRRVDPGIMYGSYRRLPASEASVPCSGRDEMCRSVLNDEWVSHPTWSSEEVGFMSARKNVYEEGLHRSEEERHEYDFHIDAVVRTVSMLEPLHNKIAQMSPEERVVFKPKPNFGGTGKSVHYRLIKKIYGRQAGLEVIQALQEQPVVAIPIVLARLKQKEEEWKRAQREWNKVWREVDARNYAKSLDYQGVGFSYQGGGYNSGFKAADKKALSTKSLVSQIELVREEQMAKRAALIDPLFARTRPRHQLEYTLSDMQVFLDTVKLTLSFLDRAQTKTDRSRPGNERNQSQMPFNERKRIEGFLRSFVPLFFMLDALAFNEGFANALIDGAEAQHMDTNSEISVSEDDNDGSGNSRGKGARRSTGGEAKRMSSSGDLRKKLLKSEQAKSTRRTRGKTQEIGSRLVSPVMPDDEAFAQAPGLTQQRSGKGFFFTNTGFYCFLRIFETLYSRLAFFKEITASRDPNALASARHPDVMHMGYLDEVTCVDRPNAECYDFLLNACERLFDNELEQSLFEDQMRFIFGIKDAYKIFTVDKVIGQLIKQVQIILSDAPSQELLENLKRDRTILVPTTQEQINSRKAAEKVLGPDENLFRIDWLPDSKMMTMQLIGKDDSSFDDSEVLTGRWQSYIEAFVNDADTTGVPMAKVHRPYLNRHANMPQILPDLDDEEVYAGEGLELKICVRTYRIFYVSRSEDLLFRAPTKEYYSGVADRLRHRNQLRSAG
ncbi:hypothetical protein FISHEDRAFT_75303 [Fistulina hepatica ATCC 64428]|uniref:Histone deacetylase interacting domain-containing protein n=1 Tax=Fistulina hepatica ATCC 64428 TaxID=1128425 RepID=A0A0D7A6X6_9AGAR|nr:hypothetical protein FISHEDRAFT_75303 [Fistulina hepatica ATCC 64428]